MKYSSSRACQTSPAAGELDSLDRDGKRISDAAFGLDHPRHARIALELAPQAQNLHVDAAIEHVLVDARGLQQVLTGERSLRRVEKGKQKREFALGQSHRNAVRI